MVTETSEARQTGSRRTMLTCAILATAVAGTWAAWSWGPHTSTKGPARQLFAPPLPAPAVPPVILPTVTGAEPLCDLPRTIQSLTSDNFELNLDLADLLPTPRGRAATVNVQLNRHAGTWQPASGRAPYMPTAVPAVLGDKVTIDGTTLRGPLQLTLRPPPATRGGESTPVEVTCQLDAKLSDPAAPSDADLATREERFWMVQAESQGTQRRVTGTYTATLGGKPVTGKLTGTLRLPVRPGYWNMGAPDGAGLKFSFDMGTRRQNWNHVRLALYQLPQPRDLTAYAGLRVRLRTPRPRGDVSVSLWLREADGSWYYVKSAVPLVDATNESVILFDDLAEAEWVAPGSHMDEDYTFDRTSVSHLAIGVVNSLGVGPVDFTLESIELVHIAPPPAVPASVQVTGKMLSVNDHEMIPAGLFGGYADDLPAEYRPGCQRHLVGPVRMDPPKPGSTELFNIDCWFDRFIPAVLLTNQNWQEDLAKWGREYGKKARDAHYQAHLEFWNEPYLNWAGRPGKNYNVAFFNVDEAQEGGPVKVRYKVQVPEPPTTATAPAPAAKSGRPPRSTAPKFRTEYRDGPVIPHFAWKHNEDGTWRIADQTQFAYWSGLGNGWIYNQMAVPLARALKETNPDAQFIAGWGFRWHEDHWAGWEMLYKPTIDATIQWLDAIHEHHYQGDTTAMVGSYEVLEAYTKTKYNKWIYCYNTETNDLIDAPARGAVDTPEKAKAATQYRRMTYNMRDILYCLAESPDKAKARTMIHYYQTPDATAVAFGLMKDLRGRMVATESRDPDLWCVASIDGTDPKSLPPGEPGKRTLVTFVFNDHREPREVNVGIQVPAGLSAAAGALEQPVVEPGTWALSVKRVALAAPTAGTTTVKLTLPARSAAKISFPLTGTPPAKAQLLRQQYFSPTILQTITRDKPVQFPIAIDPAVLATARRAYLRLVVEDIAAGEATAALGGNYILPLPKSLTADNCNRILMIPLDLSKLSAATTVEFRATPGNFASYRVDMASIVIERERLD